MKQITHNFVEWADLIKNSQECHAIGGNGGLKNFCSKMSFDMVENFPLHVFKPFG